MKRKLTKVVIVFLSIVLIVSAVLFYSCRKESMDFLEREIRFTLKPGHLASELNYLIDDRHQLAGTGKLFMKDGIFYISDNGNGKVIELSSYGDLMTLIYNPGKNPPYIGVLENNFFDNSSDQSEPKEEVLESSMEPSDNLEGSDILDEERTVSNIRVSTWDFEFVRDVIVSDEYLYILDRLPEGEGVWDSEKKENRIWVLLRFDRDGHYIDYLGQEGIGSTPFSYVSGVSIRDNGEPVVFTQANSQKYAVYFFTSQGSLKYRVDFTSETLPQQKDMIASPVVLKCDPVDYKLYLQIDYIPPTGSDQNETDTCYIYTFDIKNERFDEGIVIPDNNIKIGDETYKIPYILLGVTNTGKFFFLGREDRDTCRLLITTEKSEIVASRLLRTDESSIFYSDFFLTSDGILTMLSYYNDVAVVSWWRSDRLLRKREEE